jgi:hypothetical protein
MPGANAASIYGEDLCFWVQHRNLIAHYGTRPHILQSDNDTVISVLQKSVCSKAYRLRACRQHRQAAPGAYPSSSCPRPRCTRASTAPRALPAVRIMCPVQAPPSPPRHPQPPLPGSGTVQRALEGDADGRERHRFTPESHERAAAPWTRRRCELAFEILGCDSRLRIWILGVSWIDDGLRPVVACPGLGGGAVLHGLRRGEPVRGHRGGRQGQLRRGRRRRRHPHRRARRHQEDQRRLRARLRRHPHPPRDQATPPPAPPGHRPDQAHHAAALAPRVPRHLRRLRAHGVRPPPGHPGQRRPHGRAPPVIPLPAPPRHEVHPRRQCLPPGPQAQKHPCQWRLQA